MADCNHPGPESLVNAQSERTCPLLPGLVDQLAILLDPRGFCVSRLRLRFRRSRHRRAFIQYENQVSLAGYSRPEGEASSRKCPVANGRRRCSVVVRMFRSFWNDEESGDACDDFLTRITPTG